MSRAAVRGIAERIKQQRHVVVLITGHVKNDFHERVKIGGDVAALRAKFASTSTWAEGEQASVKQAPHEILAALATGNEDYERRFDYIFIVCATGKSADEMLALLQARLSNKPEDEILVAASEQNKITRLRLEKLLAA